jgi:hypothetical protein
MYWALSTTFCSTLQLLASIQNGDAVSQDELFEDLRAQAKSFQSPEGKEALSCPLHNYVGVFGP